MMVTRMVLGFQTPARPGICHFLNLRVVPGEDHIIRFDLDFNFHHNMFSAIEHLGQEKSAKACGCQLIVISSDH
jgi:hypothetical protein